MLYPTLNQPLMLLLLFISGVLGGIVFDASSALKALTKKDKVARHIFDFLAVLVCVSLLFMVNLFFNYGQFRVYVIIVFLISLLLERAFSKFLFAKLAKKCYSIFGRNRDKGKEK